MEDEKIVLFARLKVKPESIEEAKKLALGIVADSRSEDGCHNYDVHQAIEDPTVFTRPWKISFPLYRRLEPNIQLLEFNCVPFVEEMMYAPLGLYYPPVRDTQ